MPQKPQEVVDTGSILLDFRGVCDGAGHPLTFYRFNQNISYPCERILVQSSPRNAPGTVIEVGSAVSQSVELEAGSVVWYQIDDAITIYVSGAVGLEFNVHIVGEPRA